MVTIPFYSGIAGSSRNWLGPSVPSFPEKKFIFFLILCLRSKQHCSRFSQMLYLQQSDNHFKFSSNVGQRFSLLSSFQLEWSKHWECLWGHFDSDLFSVILRLNREILLINSAVKHKQVSSNVRSHFTLHILSLNNSTSLNYSPHRVLASVNISNHQPSQKSRLVVVVLHSQESLNLRK